MTSKEEYLKKYLGGGGEKKKKKKKVKKPTKKSIIILDDDADWKNPDQLSDEDDSDTPIIVEYRDDQKEMEMKSRWRPVVKQEVKEEPPSPSDHTRQDEKRTKNNRHDSDSDNSPVRQQISNRRGDDSITAASDGGHDSDPSPPRRQADSGVDSDVSPPRRRPQQGSDVARRPEERRKQNKVEARAATSRSSGGTTNSCSDRSNSSKMRMASGGRAGLQAGKDVKAVKRDLKDIDQSVSGKGAETVYRDKDGKRIDPKLERLKKKEEEKKKAEQDEQFYEWGRGVAQTRMGHDKVTDDLHEMSKPLARYKDDEDLEKMLMAREREDDPMLEYINRKKAKKNVTIDSHGRKKPKKERPTYKGSYPPNRFSIRPGYRWDGIDRSNGFEQSWFAREANKVATAELAYKWSVEDM